MTANKNLKRLVRARARKTGESYAAARRSFLKKSPGGPPVTQPTQSPHAPLRRTEKPEYGFAIHLPADWREESPDPFNSEWEVARFFGPGPVTRNCLVFRSPKAPDATLDAIARTVEASLTSTGFGNFRHLPAQIASLPAARLDFDRPSPDGGIWSCRHHFFLTGRHHFCVSFGTKALAEDAPLLDLLASRFELIGNPPGTSSAARVTTSTAGAAAAAAAAAAAGADRSGASSAPPISPRLRIDPVLRRRVTRYSPRARAVIIAAHREAIRRQSSAVDQPHLLSGIATVDGSVGLQILEDLGLPRPTLRQAVDALLPPLPTGAEPAAPDDPDTVVSVPMADLFQGALSLAEDAARLLGHTYVGVEHLLLGLLSQRAGPAYELLTRHGVTADAARSAFHSRVPSAGQKGPAA